MTRQMSIFDYADKDGSKPCEDCVFSSPAGCRHEKSETGFCVDGSFRIRHGDALCPDCGAEMVIRQQPFGSDGAGCPDCGTQVIFRNDGNRPGWIEAWKLGLVAVK